MSLLVADPMIGYRLWATLAAFWRWLRRERAQQPSYITDAGDGARRGLYDLRESFAVNWTVVEQGRSKYSLVVYAATIGEFHPLIPIIDAYLDRWPETRLVIFSGQWQYCDAIHAAYPQAAVGVPPPGAPWLYGHLFRLLKPRVVVIGEGPCLYGHFPIPLELALPATCLGYNVPLVVVNATMFPYRPASRLDRVEGRLFAPLYRNAIRCWYTQNEIFRSWLVRAGVPEERIVITGDLRYDSQRPLDQPTSELHGLLNLLAARSGPIIVAGSVNALDEQGPVIEGWLRVCKNYPEARLIIAPRHVNNSENMARLYNFLRQKKVRFSRRSEGAEAALAADVIVVDVFGELPHYYSLATIAYIGRNHTLLEPLRFNVPTVVAPRCDWASDYVTFPAYMQLIEEGGVVEVDDKANLGQVFVSLIENASYGHEVVGRALAVGERQRGASKRILDHLEAMID